MNVTSDSEFIFPAAAGPNEDFDADLTWTLGSTQNIQWRTTLDSYDIGLLQQGTDPPPDHQPGTIYSVGSGGGGQQAFKWQVQTYNTNLTFGHVYFLWLAPMDSQGTITSHYFNITDQAQSMSGTTSSTAFASSTSLTSSTTALTSSTSLASSIIASSISSTPSQRSSQTPVTPPAGASSNTELLRIGFGVSLGIGVPLVLLAGMWIGLRLVKSRQSSSRGMNPSGPLSQVSKTEHPPNSYPNPSQSSYYANQVQEAPGGSHEILEAPEGRALIELGSRDT